MSPAGTKRKKGGKGAFRLLAAVTEAKAALKPESFISDSEGGGRKKGLALSF